MPAPSILHNPFVTGGYVSAQYFCDREREREQLLREVANGNHLAIISTRRMGKTGLIQHCFLDKGLSKGYYTFFVDIYATKSLRDFTFALSKVLLEGLKPFGRKALETFMQCAMSLHAGISFDMAGNPSFELQLGDIQDSEATLDELFTYLSKADRPCIVAIDEFQQIASYPEKNMEALLRTYIQRCPNARFIFAGSQRHVMGNMFLSPARPFYQSVSMMRLDAIPLQAYTDFAVAHFREAGKEVAPETVAEVYARFGGVTWYMQKILNLLFSSTPQGGVCGPQAVGEAVASVVDSFKFTYQEMMFRMPEKQGDLLVAIAKEGDAMGVTSGAFVKRYRLASPSSVQSALRGLLDKDFVTTTEGGYRVYDQFFELWLRENY